MFVLYLKFLFTINTFVLKYDGFFFFTETYQAAKFIERDGEFQIEEDLDTGEVDTVYITICIYVGY